MNTERQVFQKIKNLIASEEIRKLYGYAPLNDAAYIKKLKQEAVDAFYEDHPEVRTLFLTTPFEVNFYGENAAYRYTANELVDEHHSKLKKCLTIMEELFQQLDEPRV